LSRVGIVKQDDTGKRARVTAEDEAKGRVECGEGMPGEGSSLGGRGVLRPREILPWRSGGIEGGREGEEEEVVIPRSGIVPVSIVRIRFTAIDEKGVVNDSDGLPPS
jgi:hypothetical protein